MNVLERLKQLEAAATPGPWYYRDSDETIRGRLWFLEKEIDVCVFNAWGAENIPRDQDWPNCVLTVEMRNALPKLLAVAQAAKDFINSDGDYFSWTEDERHCMSRLREALAALEEDV
jgi:hypothetical protein